MGSSSSVTQVTGSLPVIGAVVDGVDTPAMFRPSNSTFYFRHGLSPRATQIPSSHGTVQG